MRNELIGPRNSDHESRPAPEDVRLANNIPLYHIFLKNPDAVNLSATDAQEAKRRLSEVIAVARDKVLSCQGKSRQEAESILGPHLFS